MRGRRMPPRQAQHHEEAHDVTEGNVPAVAQPSARTGHATFTVTLTPIATTSMTATIATCVQSITGLWRVSLKMVHTPIARRQAPNRKSRQASAVAVREQTWASGVDEVLR